MSRPRQPSPETGIEMNRIEQDDDISPVGSSTDVDTNGEGDGQPKPDEPETPRPQSTPPPAPPRPDGKVELREIDCPEKLGFGYATRKKWTILSVIFIVQCSMNFNASVYANAIQPLSEHFSIGAQTARLGQMIFLVAYAFGSELWAPWSEELGRWPVLQVSLFFVNIWQIPCALAPNFTTILVSRFLGGLSSAGGSVTLGMVADMWNADDQQYAVAFIVLSSVGGSALGPIVGGFIQRYLAWYWNFYIQLIFGVVVQAVHFFLVPETRVSLLLDKEAQRRRNAGEDHIWSTNELKGKGMEMKEVIEIWWRPFQMFLYEPIVLWLSLLSGFSDALIFTFLESFTPVFKQWGFGTTEVGLTFITLIIGYFIAYASFFPFIHKHRAMRRKDPNSLQPEARLYWLLWVAPLETVGLFGFAWTCVGPPMVHWMAPLVFATLIAVANYAIYMATIDYMIASYGPYSASATGGNALARDFLAGIAALYSTPFYENIGNKYRLEWPTTILGGLALMVTIPIYIFYWKGPVIRERSKFAMSLASDRAALLKKEGEDGEPSEPTDPADVEAGHNNSGPTGPADVEAGHNSPRPINQEA